MVPLWASQHLLQKCHSPIGLERDKLKTRATENVGYVCMYECVQVCAVHTPV